MGEHFLNSGERPRVGLRVFTNDYTWGTIVQVKDAERCGDYCAAWHTVQLDSGRTTIYNCDRLTTREPRRGW